MVHNAGKEEWHFTGGIVDALRIIREYRSALVVTIRERYSYTLDDLRALPFGDAVAFIMAAARDTTTVLGQTVNGWKYPASYAEVIIISALAGKELLPFDSEVVARGEGQQVTAAEESELLAYYADHSAFR